MILTNNKRLFQLTPVTEAVPPFRENKYPMVPTGDIGTLDEFINVPANLINDVRGYKRRLMFQYNVGFTKDFRISNVSSLQRFASYYLLGGCLCIKFREDTSVFRYKIMDSAGINDNWSGFNNYVNQIIKANFCLEFWQNDSNFARGITQAFLIKLDTIIQPSDTSQSDTVNQLANPVLSLDDLQQLYPLNYPINFTNQSGLDNVI